MLAVTSPTREQPSRVGGDPDTGEAVPLRLALVEWLVGSPDPRAGWALVELLGGASTEGGAR